MPVSIISAWNTLYEALKERADYYGMTLNENRIHPLPEAPCKTSGLWAMTEPVAQRIFSMIKSSVNRHNFNQWMPLASFGQPQDGRDPFFPKWGLDGYALEMIPEILPQRKHTATDFIRAAAKILNDAVRYPLPVFDDTVKLGLGINAELYARSAEENLTVRQDYAESGKIDLGNTVGRPYFQPITPSTLAQRTSKDDCTGRASGHHWVYRGAGKTFSRNYAHKLPVLRGIGKVRSKMSVRHVVSGQIRREIDLGIREEVMDFSAGRSAGNIDLSAAEEMIDETLDYTGSWSDVTLTVSEKEVMINETNFQPLPYKYLE